MIETGLSIRDRTGKIDHNFRLTKKKDKDGNYIPMHRTHIDEERSRYNVILEQADPDPYKCVERVYRDNMTDALKDYNTEQIRKGHPERVRTVESYMADIETSYAKDRKRNPPLFHEKVIKVGDKKSMPSFVYDENGNKVLSEEGKKSIAILTDYYHVFKKKNPNLKICACVIHADERGSVHMHLDYVAFSMDNKRGLRVRNSMSGALKEQYEKQGINCKNSRYNNPLKNWTQEQREIVTELASIDLILPIISFSGFAGLSPFSNLSGLVSFVEVVSANALNAVAEIIIILRKTIKLFFIPFFIACY